MSRFLVVASDHVGSTMAGPGIRYLWFARELARRGHDVTLVVPLETDLHESGFEVLVDKPWNARRMTALALRYDGVVAQRLPVPTMLALARSRTRAVYDLYAPTATEGVASLAHRFDAAPRAEFKLARLTLGVALETGDAFVCANERQRDLWVGALAAVGRVEPGRYRHDPSLRSFVAVVPFGIDPTPPAPGAGNVLKGVLPGIAAGDKVALWGGGIWNWLDPLTVIRAVHQLARPEVKLVFLGTQRPEPNVPQMEMQARAIGLADELGLLSTSIFFKEGWVPYAELGAYLLEADAGVAAHADDLETRYAFRTRLLDCVWAGLPIVTTSGDSLSELVAARGLGRVVAAGDVDGYAEALAAVLDGGRTMVAVAAAEASRELEWPRVVDTLAELLEQTTAGAPVPPWSARVPRVARYVVLRTRFALQTRGALGVARRATATITRGDGSRSAGPGSNRPR